VGGVEDDRVDGAVAGADLEVQVRSGAAAFVAAVGDQLAGPDGLADGDRPAPDVTVDRDDVAGVPNLDPLPEPAGRAGGKDGAVAGGVDRRTDGRTEIDAGVQPPPADAEPGGDGGALDGPDPATGGSGAGGAGGRVGVGGYEVADPNDVTWVSAYGGTPW